MGDFTNPVAAALAALSAYGASQGASDESNDPTSVLPFLEHQDYDPTLPNFQAKPYESSTVPPAGEIQMPEDHVDTVHHLAPATPQSVPVMSDREHAYREGVQPAPTDVQGADYQADQALQDAAGATQSSKRADLAAQGDTSNRLADAYQKAYDETGRINQDYQTARSLARQQADAETAQWMQQYQDLAAKEPNPHRWFESKSSFGKAMWAISLVAGALRSGLSGGQLPNVALEAAQKEIQGDIDLQKQRLDKQLGALRMKGEALQKHQAQNLTDLTDDHTMALGRLNALQQEYMARAQVPGKPQMDAADQQVMAWFAQQKATIADKKATEARQAREAQLSRAQAMAIANMNDRRERAIANANIQKDYDLAKLQADSAGDVAKAKAEADAQKDLRGTDPSLGLYLKGGTYGDGIVRTHKDDQNFEKMNQVAQAANQRYSDLGLVETALKDDNFYDLITKKDPALVQAVTRLGYSTAKADDPGGRVNDEDFKKGVQQSLGYDPVNGVVDPMQVSRNRDAMLKAIATEKKNLVPRTQKALAVYNDVLVNGKGSTIYWSPKSVTAPEAPTPNAMESLGKTLPPPKDLNELHEREKQAEAQPEYARQLLPVNQDKVTEAKSAFQGRGPDFIDKRAAQLLDQWDQGYGLDPTTRLMIEDEAHKAREKASQALEDFETSLRTRNWSMRGSSRAEASDIAKKDFGLFLDPEELTAAIKAAEAGTPVEAARRLGK